jgi:predicted Fe-Mo cluster-binding NifX family protein
VSQTKGKKVAVPVNDQGLESKVAPVFGRATYFCIYDLETGKTEYVENAGAISQGGAGIKAAQCVVDAGASLLFTPQCGDNAAEVIRSAEIEMYQSVEGTVEENIKNYQAGKLALLESTHAGFHHGEK